MNLYYVTLVRLTDFSNPENDRTLDPLGPTMRETSELFVCDQYPTKDAIRGAINLRHKHSNTQYVAMLNDVVDNTLDFLEEGFTPGYRQTLMGHQRWNEHRNSHFKRQIHVERHPLTTV